MACTIRLRFFAIVGRFEWSVHGVGVVAVGGAVLVE